MSIIDNILAKFKSKKEQENAQTVDYTQIERLLHDMGNLDVLSELVKPKVAGTNFLAMYNTIAEVFWPIHYIASRISGGRFILRRAKDDSIVWSNKPINAMLSMPNAITPWRELVYSHFVYKLATGNAFMRAAVADTFSGEDITLWKYCSNYWELPSNLVDIVPASYGTNVPIFGIAEKDEIIKGYNVGYENLQEIDPKQIWHDRDTYFSLADGGKYLQAKSRLLAVSQSIGNLLAVYEARNIIYVKRGGLGYLVSQKKDVTGSVALTDSEKKELEAEHFKTYGLKADKMPYGISPVPLQFIRTNLSISELMPFEETLADAITIASAYNIPSVLVPRKDQSTYNNQAAAEKAVYTSTIIPMAKRFCEDLTIFLGLDENDLYLDCDFSDIDCLQSGRKEAEDVKTLVNNRCECQFLAGLITLNDWRAQIGEAQIEEKEMPLFSKLKFQMSDEELAIIDKIIISTQAKIGGNNDGGKSKEPGVQDQGE